MAMKVCCIHLKPGFRQEHDAQLALDAREIFDLKARKAGDLKIPPGREIRSLALVVLAVLSLCLPSFAHGQGQLAS